MRFDPIETLFAAATVLVVVGLAGLLGFGIYDAATADTFALRKDRWTCTRSHTALIPMTTMVGKVPVTTQMPQSVCDQWTAR